ncbi:MAG: YetF domain-containing protein [Desulforhopalus sp.]
MIIFDSWQHLIWIAGTALLFYPLVIILVRVAGKRSTAKMNNYDWIATIAIGSIMGSVILLKDVTLVDGLASIVILLSLQYALTKISVKMPTVSKAIHAEPVLLYYNGTYRRQDMDSERVTQNEIEAAVRRSGYGGMTDITAVVMETDASLSVIKRTEGPSVLLENLKIGIKGEGNE